MGNSSRLPSAELAEIRRVLNALVSISELPLLWRDPSNQAIAEQLASILVKILDADFVHVFMAAHPQSLEVAYGPLGPVPAALISDVRSSLHGLPFRRPSQIQSAVSGEPATVFSTPLGARGQAALTVALKGSTYPTKSDKLMLRMAVNEATAAMERAEGLFIARHLTTMVSLSSNFIGVADLRGVPLFVNPAGLKLVGMASIEEARELNVVDFIEFRDQDRVLYEVWPEVLSKGRWSGQLSFLNAKTDNATPLLVECFRIDTPTTEPVAVGTISVDIRKWNRAEGTFNDPPALEKTRQLMLAAARVESLSERERQVLDALVAGYSHKVIAYELGISVRTIESHRSRMMQRLGVRTLADAIKLAIISGAVK